ncbi:MAG: MFS transporter [Clostridiales bacterium]|nr:MFS transporter [Clostridiales bacterium]
MATDFTKRKNYWAFGTKGWGVAGIGILFYFFWQGPMYSASNFWFGALEEMFGWSVPSMSLPITLAGILSLFGVILWGGLAKKLGAKRVIIICLLCAAASNMIFVGFMTLWSFGLSIILFFFFSMGYSVIGVGQLGADWFPHTKGVYMGIVTVGSTINMASINMVLAFAVPAFGIGPSLAAYSIIQVIGAVIVGVFIKNTPEEAGAFPDNDKSITREKLMEEFKAMEEYKKRSPWTVKVLLKNATMWKIGVAWGLAMMCGVGIIQQLVQVLVSYGHPFMLGITFLTLGWPIGVFGHILVGVIDLRLGTRNTSIIMAIILLASPAALLLAGATMGGAVIAAGLLMFGISGVANVTMSMTTTTFGRKDFENAWPVISTIFQVISNAGVLIIAVLASLITYQFSMGVVVGILVVVIIVMLLTPKGQITATGAQVEPETDPEPEPAAE